MKQDKIWGKDKQGNVYYECQACHVINNKYHSKGLCERCYMLKWYHKQNPDQGYFNRWALHYDCCVKCGTTEARHMGNGLCNKCYLRKKSNMDPILAKNIDDYKTGKRWSIKHDKCIQCNTTEIKHQARGLCLNCYQKKIPRIWHIIICKGCGKKGKHQAKGLCHRCYEKQRPGHGQRRIIICKNCKKQKPHVAKGLCDQCLYSFHKKKFFDDGWKNDKIKMMGIDKSGYVRVKISGYNTFRHVINWARAHGRLPINDVHHINGKLVWDKELQADTKNDDPSNLEERPHNGTDHDNRFITKLQNENKKLREQLEKFQKGEKCHVSE